MQSLEKNRSKVEYLCRVIESLFKWFRLC